MKIKNISSFDDSQADALAIKVGNLCIQGKDKDLTADQKPVDETISETSDRKSCVDVDKSLLIPKGPSRTNTSHQVRNQNRPYFNAFHQNVTTVPAERKFQTGGSKVADGDSFLWNDYTPCYEHIPLPVEDLANRLHEPCVNINADDVDSDYNSLMDAVLSSLEKYEFTGSLLPTSPSSCDSPDNSDRTSQCSPSSQYSPWTSPQQSPEQPQPVSLDAWKEFDINNSQRAVYVGSEASGCDTFNSNLVELKPSNCKKDLHVDLRNVPVANFFSSEGSPSMYHNFSDSSGDHYSTIYHKESPAPMNSPNLFLEEEQSYMIQQEVHSPKECNRVPSQSAPPTSDLGEPSECFKFPRQFSQYPTSPPLNIPNLTSLQQPLERNLEFKPTNFAPTQPPKPVIEKSSPKRIAPLRANKPHTELCRKSKTSTQLLTPSKKIQTLLKPQSKMAVWMAVSLEPWNKFSKKNKDGQTKLMQAILCQPKPTTALEWVYSIAQRMKNEKERGLELLTAKDKNGLTALYHAAMIHPDTPELAAYIADLYNSVGSNVNETFLNGNTLLHCLAAQGESHADVMKELLLLTNNGNRLFNVNAQNEDGDTPLHEAAHSHCEENSTYSVADILIKAGADITIQNENGETPLHVAAKTGYCEPSFFRKLLENPGAVNIQDSDGNTPLHLLVFNVNFNNIQKMKKIMEQLLSSSARTDIENKAGRLAITYIHQDHRQVFNFLFSSKKL